MESNVNANSCIANLATANLSVEKWSCQLPQTRRTVRSWRVKFGGSLTPLYRRQDSICREEDEQRVSTSSRHNNYLSTLPTATPSRLRAERSRRRPRDHPFIRAWSFQLPLAASLGVCGTRVKEYVKRCLLRPLLNLLALVLE